MREFELIYSKTGVETLESRLKMCGLEFKRLPLKTLPNAVHWHITKPSSKGTLEATWEPDSQRFWLSTRAIRYAEWQEDAITDIIAKINKP